MSAPPPPTCPLLAFDLADEAAVLAARHAGREVAVALGVDPEIALRVATSVGELARDVLTAGGGRIAFELPQTGLLQAVLTTRGRPEDLEEALEGARRLMDRVELATGPDAGTVVVLGTPLDPPVELGPEPRRALAVRLAERVARSAIDDLQETNRATAALYEELSGELETTNQGVVALYAELDDKSRQLREASESKTRFLNNISHELRTPGNSVLGLARLLLDPGADPLTADQREQVEFIRASAEDLLRLVNELLDLAKAESGRVEPTVEPVDLAALFEELRGTIGPLVTRDAVVLDVRPPTGVEGLRTDVTLLRHVLRNLLSNAVKFTERGAVSLSAEAVADPGGPRLRVTVRDTGIGISENDQPRVFEEFFQVRGTLQAQAKGSGLGLPFARRLAVLLGGDLSLASVPGEGTVFTLDLPLAGPSGSHVQQGATP